MNRTLLRAVCALLMMSILCAGLNVGVAEDRVDLNIIAVAGNYANITTAEGTPVYEMIQNAANVNLTVTPMDTDKWNVTMAGGDTTDIIVFEIGKYLDTLVESELIIPLNDLLNKYGQDILSSGTEDSLKHVADIVDDGTDLVYCLPYGIGAEGGNAKATNSGLLTRWDLYKELGAPAVANMDEYAEVLAQMVALQPSTADGLPVYGVALYTADNSFGSMLQYVRCQGFEQYNDWIATRVSDSSLSYAYTDTSSSFWAALDFCHKAYTLGILDPDSFTQKFDDLQTKKDNGQILTPIYRDHIKKLQADWMAADPETDKGFEVIPMEGSSIAENKHSVFGAAYGFAIASTCKNPERAMAFINTLSKPEIARAIYSGIEGVNWDYADGVPTPTDETIALKRAGGEAWAATGVNNNALYGMVGLARGVMLKDGGTTDLYRSAGFLAKDVDSVDRDFCAYYGDYAYPNAVILDKGTSDLSTLDMRIASGYGTAPEDIQRIDARLMEMALRAIPGIIMTKTDEEYEAAKAAALQSFIDAGAEESYAYWYGRWEELKTMYAD